MAGNGRRVLVLGLDSVPPELLFERFLPRMPNLQKLLARSRWGTLKACEPPITVPSWAVMFSGMDPGSLGIYGFRHRRPKTYFDTYAPNPQMLPHPPAWEILSRQGERVCVVGMPPGYPPPRVNGVYVSDFLTPDGAKDFVYPPTLAAEILGVAGGYEFDVTFRAEDRERIGQELFEMTRKRWAVARHLWNKEAFDFFALHEIGPDRLHHTFWKYFDETHPRYEKHPAFAKLVDDYYVLMDEEIGKFLANVPEDVVILVLSDHGSQGMDGCFCINEWLIQKGYLKLKGPAPPRGTAIEKLAVDWSRTTAWGAGGYYARLFFNVKGREPEGIVAAAQVPALTEKIGRELAQVTRPDGAPLGPDIRVPAKIYREVRGDAPDLMIYFGNLKWRSAGTLGHGSLFLQENDTGPDDSVHSFDGVIALADPTKRTPVHLPPQAGIDVGATVLKIMGFDPPARMQGKPMAALLE
ncbi:MAG TPA: alkaline phosphatase family protein [Thermoplasmata archaeon]|nr:alkaline phosphatase family protein [Thermoplasmata archaeon]